MKKLLITLIGIFCLVSCDCMEWCPRCQDYHNWDEICPYESKGGNYYHNTNQDMFCQSKLIGYWQTVGTTVDNIEILSIRFLNDLYCDVEIKERNGTDNPTYTYSYLYSQKYIRLTRNGKTIQFNIDGYLYPTLTVYDSFGKYKWDKKW